MNPTLTVARGENVGWIRREEGLASPCFLSLFTLPSGFDMASDPAKVHMVVTQIKESQWTQTRGLMQGHCRLGPTIQQSMYTSPH
jgi:hypothetical protein